MTLDYRDQAHWPNGFGQQQSPIQLTQATVTHRGAQTLKVVAPYLMTQERDDETTIKLLGNGELMIGDHHYHCVQAHFHEPIEHQLDHSAAFELHFVHQTALGQLCVIAVLMGEGEANPVVQAIIDAFVAGTQTPVTIDMTPLIPTSGGAYHYLGSLTTPPLTEGVEWYVLDAPQLTVSAQQAAWFLQQFAANNRDLQPQAGRQIEYFELK